MRSSPTTLFLRLFQPLLFKFATNFAAIDAATVRGLISAEVCQIGIFLPGFLILLGILPL